MTSELYDFLYPQFTGLIKQMGHKIKTSYQPQEDLWAAAEEKLWQAGILPSSTYSPLVYVVAYRGMIDWIRQDDKSFIPPTDTTDDSWVPRRVIDFGETHQKNG